MKEKRNFNVFFYHFFQVYRRHYLSIIQEEEELASTEATPSSSRTNSRPSSIYGLQGLQPVPVDADLLSKALSSSAAAAGPAPPAPSVASSCDVASSLNDATSINSILSQEAGGPASNMSFSTSRPTSRPHTVTSLAEVVAAASNSTAPDNIQAAQSLSNLLEYVRPPAASPPPPPTEPLPEARPRSRRSMEVNEAMALGFNRCPASLPVAQPPPVSAPVRGGLKKEIDLTKVNFDKQQKLAGKKPMTSPMLVKVLSKSTAVARQAETESSDGKSDLQRLKEDITASTQSLETLKHTQTKSKFTTMRERLKSALHNTKKEDNMGSQTSINSTEQQQPSKVSKFFSLKSVLGGGKSLSGSLAGSVTSLDVKEETAETATAQTLDRKMTKQQKSGLLRRSNSLRQNSAAEQKSSFYKLNSSSVSSGGEGGETAEQVKGSAWHTNGTNNVGEKGSWRSPGRFLFSSNKQSSNKLPFDEKEVSRSTKKSSKSLTNHGIERAGSLEYIDDQSVAPEATPQNHDVTTRAEVGGGRRRDSQRKLVKPQQTYHDESNNRGSVYDNVNGGGGSVDTAAAVGSLLAECQSYIELQLNGINVPPPPIIQHQKVSHYLLLQNPG